MPSSVVAHAQRLPCAIVCLPKRFAHYIRQGQAKAAARAPRQGGRVLRKRAAHLFSRFVDVIADPADGEDADDDDQGQHHRIFNGGRTVFMAQEIQRRARYASQHENTSWLGSAPTRSRKTVAMGRGVAGRCPQRETGLPEMGDISGHGAAVHLWAEWRTRFMNLVLRAP